MDHSYTWQLKKDKSLCVTFFQDFDLFSDYIICFNLWKLLAFEFSTRIQHFSDMKKIFQCIYCFKKI